MRTEQDLETAWLKGRDPAVDGGWLVGRLWPASCVYDLLPRIALEPMTDLEINSRLTRPLRRRELRRQLKSLSELGDLRKENVIRGGRAIDIYVYTGPYLEEVRKLLYARPK
jgi:hypothetical protein